MGDEQYDEPPVRTVGDLRARLEGVPDDTPIHGSFADGFGNGPVFAGMSEDGSVLEVFCSDW